MDSLRWRCEPTEQPSPLSNDYLASDFKCNGYHHPRSQEAARLRTAVKGNLDQHHGF